ncbi:MAG: hypothetical protein B6U89_00360 [Desulfurococcales archaeon ex4484_58]|nr:MAG: hypothetical protein B6U89_00360 [Desulfurococcales archaeon ex4484_58]
MSLRNYVYLAVSITLSVIFTLSMFFTIFVLPHILNNLFLNPSLNRVESRILISEICFFMFIVSILLIIIGYMVRRAGISVFGSILFFLPTYGNFALYMTLLGGAGILRSIWLPLVMITGEAYILTLGSTVFLLPIFILSIPIILGLDTIFLQIIFSILVIIGGLILGFSTTTWIQYYVERKGLIKTGLYKYIRHPQYLAYILWFYLSFALDSMYCVSPFTKIPAPGLPFTILFYTLIYKALSEEVDLLKKYGDEYREYREQSSFIIPLPLRFKKLLLSISRKVIGKDLPDNIDEVRKVVFTYFILTLLISMPFDFILYNTAWRSCFYLRL